ncbi:type II toxin-antitoxin system HipA family toxin YjjJ [Pseudomarimonas arenosa]|uniref:Type II toxin-antitoxin system HipA family toxin YjjJ n=1 Tax=Pseudomarimonas arenosa TaxID=2774145 RepID=A0AAW3ZQH2_9GAMM|nr:type II toxin-antitoxin system HipA family toxin YjjJ [Pseudomarimonas arenosa]MBD8527978.1 type II toxin-antitoxin system HipA family toxin YjjJ [Pseudomarimonas arenosa]
MADRSASVSSLLSLLGQRGALRAAEVLQALGVSRATLSRTVKQARGEVLRFGETRSTVYATSRQIGGQSAWPLYRITADAKVELLGELLAIGRTEFALRPTRPLPALTLPPLFGAGVFPDLPWFLDDQRPQGFLGRHFAHRLSATLGVPRDLKLWTGDHTVTALVECGHDQLGDLVLGERGLERALAGLDQPADVLQPEDRATAYPALAMAALQGEPVGSLLGGEQQKFTAMVGVNGGVESLIVKFSEAGGNPVATRWASLLRSEATAARVLNEGGIAAAADRVFEAAGHVFLESPRFDRTPGLGRRGLVSLAALDAAFYGHASTPWWQFAEQLHRDGWIGADDADALQRIYWFGAMIGNSDMHLGNASLVLRDSRPLTLAPVYDMLPMAWRPSAQGALVPRTLTLPIPAAGQLAQWRWAAEAAAKFWAAVRADAAIDSELREAANKAQELVDQGLRRFV